MAKEWRKVWQVTRFSSPASRSIFHRPLNHALVEVMAVLETVLISPARARRKDPLPFPRFRRRRDLSVNGVGEPGRTEFVAQVSASAPTRTPRWFELRPRARPDSGEIAQP
jgi:hypothetical protein